MIGKRKIYSVSVLLLLSASLIHCASLNDMPLMGTVTQGIYTQPQGNFSCPLTATGLGLNGEPDISDAIRVTRTVNILPTQGSPTQWRRTKLIPGRPLSSRTVKLTDKSGTVIEISSGKYIHEIEKVLYSGMSGGVAWRFDQREIIRTSGRMAMGLLLVPWHNEANSYMGINAAQAYKQGQGSDAQLWIVSNILMNKTIHTIIIKLPFSLWLTTDISVRELSAVRDDVQSRPELQESLFAQASHWLAQCHFAEEVK